MLCLGGQSWVGVQLPSDWLYTCAGHIPRRDRTSRDTDYLQLSTLKGQVTQGKEGRNQLLICTTNVTKITHRNCEPVSQSLVPSIATNTQLMTSSTGEHKCVFCLHSWSQVDLPSHLSGSEAHCAGREKEVKIGRGFRHSFMKSCVFWCT